MVDEEQAAQDVAEHERPAAVEAVGERSGEGAQQHRGGQPQDEDAGDGEVLGGVGAAGQVLGERGGGEQAEPVAEARPAEGQPQAAEGHDAQDGGDVVLGRVVVGPVPPGVGSDLGLGVHRVGRPPGRPVPGHAALRAGGCRPSQETGQVPGHGVSVARGPRQPGQA